MGVGDINVTRSHVGSGEVHVTNHNKKNPTVAKKKKKNADRCLPSFVLRTCVSTADYSALLIFLFIYYFKNTFFYRFLAKLFIL